ncbi:MAG: type IV secretion system DNA-binding domain-containing protein [Acidobacteria bacterium]|nr:type IV secretion system DNA-binding domain-containing protein [Acidobacteriota bacterium]
MVARLVAAGAVTAWWMWAYPLALDDRFLVFIRQQTPAWYWPLVVWSALSPGVLVLVLGSVAESVWRVWFERYRPRGAGASRLPPWPLSPDDPEPGIVIGEVHHPSRIQEAREPTWLVMRDKALYTGTIVFGAVGTGKTSACMRPFVQQLLSWRAHDEERRAAGLCLEVKGDFCNDVKAMLAECGREDDYVELNLEREGFAWNPLDAPWMDSSSLAYTIASLLNQLHGRGKEPFWQQAYSDLARWIIVFKRLEYPPWVTLRDIYRYSVDQQTLGEDINAMEAVLKERWNCPNVWEVTLGWRDHRRHAEKLGRWKWRDVGGGRMCTRQEARADIEPLVAALREAGAAFEEEESYRGIPWGLGREAQKHLKVDQSATHEAVTRWYSQQWLGLAEQTRTNVVTGLAVFLGMFDLPETGRKFAPPCPEDDSGVAVGLPPCLPPLYDLMESGKVLALNMPAGENPNLARTLGVMLKQAWLSTLLLRPARMQEEWNRDRYWRPVLFVVDEYQQFATVGESDPSGDEKAFALTRQSKCIPLLATQSLSSLRSALGAGESWRALLQTIRSRIYLALGDDASAKTASELCGQVSRMVASYSVSENTARAGVSFLSGRAGGGGSSAGLSKSYQARREALFTPRDFTVLGNYQAIAQIFDGKAVADAVRCYLFPDYLVKKLGKRIPWWRAKEQELF